MSTRRQRSKKKLMEMNNGRLTHNIELVKPKGWILHRNSKEPLNRVAVGTVVKVMPDEIHDYFKKPVVYFEDKHNFDKYTGVIDKLNPRDISLREYDVKIAHVSDNPKLGKIVHLQQYVSRGDLIFTQALEYRKEDNSRFFGTFMDYSVNLNGINPESDLRVSLGDYVLGRAYNIKASSMGNRQARIYLEPISIKTEDQYLKYKDMIFHSDRSKEQK